MPPPEHWREYLMGMPGSLSGRLNDAAENVLRLGATPGTVPATDFASHDRRPERLFSTIVGGVQPGQKQETPERVEFAIEMAHESRDGGDGTAARESRPELADEVPTRHREAMIGHGAGAMPITQGQGGAEDPLDLDDDGRVRMIATQFPSPA